MELASRRASASVAVVWERRPYRQHARFRIQFTPVGQADQRLTVSLSQHQGWRPPTVLPIVGPVGTQTCVGRIAQGQSLWVRIDNARGESQAATWLIYHEGELRPEGAGLRLALWREGPVCSWTWEQVRLSLVNALLCGAALSLVLAAQVALPLAPRLRQLAWISVLLLLWQGGSALLFRKQFRLGRVLPALCILATGILYLTFSLIPHPPH